MAGVAQIEHPDYVSQKDDWEKFRLTYQGGVQFVEEYLKQYERESTTDFADRLEVTPCPRFAGAGIDEIKNSIFQRMAEIARIGGTPTYQDATKGLNYGVDLLGSSMNTFIGSQVLPELLSMNKIGIFVDMPDLSKINTNVVTVADVVKQNIRPYLYIYKAEDIRSWSKDEGPTPNEFSRLLLRELRYKNDEEFGLPIDIIEVYKYFFIEDGVVNVRYYNAASQPIDPYTLEPAADTPIVLDMWRIPFVVLELSHPLLKDIADFQIALLNMNSSDINYSLKMNFPFYTEQFDFRAMSPYLKEGEGDDNTSDIKIGATSGRRYGPGMERPGFINPSPDPLLASMKKQDQLKSEIKTLLNLAITSLEPKMASAESKGMDARSLESGLSYIALELEHAEQQVGQIWSLYEGSEDFPTVKYPEKYNLKSDEDRRQDAKQYNELLGTIPSKTFQKEVAKIIGTTLLKNKVSDDLLNTINTEIDAAQVVSIPAEIISKDVELGLVSAETASLARGYPPGEVEKAKADHAERLARISESQSNNNNNLEQSQRGIPDRDENQSPEANADKEKADSRNLDTSKQSVDNKVKDKGRGPNMVI
jgi:hypothetical protein